jgi:hypothetical protein
MNEIIGWIILIAELTLLVWIVYKIIMLGIKAQNKVELW